MPKVNYIDKAIASLEAERAILDLAIAKLRAQQQREKPAEKKAGPRREKTDKGLNAGQDNGE